MAAMQALTMAGPMGALGYWQHGPARNRFEPAMHPDGRFSGRVANGRILPPANSNHIPYVAFEMTRQRRGLTLVKPTSRLP